MTFAGLPPDDGVRRNILGNQRSRCDDGTAPDRNARENDSTRTDPDIILDDHAGVVFGALLVITYGDHRFDDDVDAVVPAADRHLGSEHDIVANDDFRTRRDQDRTIAEINIVADADRLE